MNDATISGLQPSFLIQQHKGKIVPINSSFGSTGLRFFSSPVGSRDVLPPSIKHLLAEVIFLGGVMYDEWDSAYVLVVDLSGRSSREDLNPFDQCFEQINPFFQLT